MAKTYTVWVKLELEKDFTVKAENEQEAREMAEDMAMSDDLDTFDCTSLDAYDACIN